MRARASDAFSPMLWNAKVSPSYAVSGKVVGLAGGPKVICSFPPTSETVSGP